MTCKNCLSQIEEWVKYCPHCGYSFLSKTNKKHWTLSEVYNSWKSIHFRRVSIQTRKNLEYGWSKLEPLAHYRFTDLDVDDYQKIIDSNGTSYGKQQQIRKVISALCSYGVKYRLLDFNLSTFLILDAPKGTPKNIFEDREILLISNYATFQNLQYSYDAKIVMCLILTGLRPNEFFSLRKHSVNIEGQYLIGGGKTAAGTNRMIPIPSAIFGFIKEWYSSAQSKNDYLVRTENGRKINLNNWRKRNFYPLLSKLKINPPYRYGEAPYIPVYVPYSCRHTFASLSARAKMDKDVLCKIIGHTDPAFTQQVYIHQKIGEYREEMLKLENLIESFSL